MIRYKCIYKNLNTQFQTQNNFILKLSTIIFHKIYINIHKKHYSLHSEHCDIELKRIRNFSIIAHVDHGKSTLADRLLEITGAIKANAGQQILDTLQVEKERGITVKAQTASLNYTYNGNRYLLNLIDTPGHVDFSAEVHRSLAPCQGVVLVIDANEGVQAQTVANYHLAKERNLIVIPVINKIDLPNANPNQVIKQLHNLFNIDENDILQISAKRGIGITKVLDSIIERVPPPNGSKEKPMRALIFDSWFDKYKGAISLIYIHDGHIKVNQNITLMHTKKSYQIKTLSMLRPAEENVTTLLTGQIGCITCGMKNSSESNVGDTIFLKKSAPVEPLIGFKSVKPMVYVGVYPLEKSDFMNLKSAIEKLVVNDSSVTVTFESSLALGRGWRIGFLGLLHMEVFIQRLQQEYNAEPIVTMPSVVYKAKIIGEKNIKKYKTDMITFNNPSTIPNEQIVSQFLEPFVQATIIVSNDHINKVIELCNLYRGKEQSFQELDSTRSIFYYLLPLNEILTDFHDELKRVTSGYASFDYEEHSYEPTEIKKLDVLLNGNVVEEFSTIVHLSKAEMVAKKLCLKLKEMLPRQQFAIAIQVAMGKKILARQDLKAYRKDVTAKLYGGDVTRRQKLLTQQAEGKRKLKAQGNIQIPQDVFIKILRK